MSDAPHDPMDKAYAQAEAVLNDEAARAARRARVLGAVAQATPDAATPTSRPAWRRGGWLVAASVAGLSVLVATQIRPPAPIGQPPAPAAPTAPAVTADEGPGLPPSRAAEAPPATPQQPRRMPAVAPEGPAPAPAQAPAFDVAKVEAAPPPPPPPPPPQMARARPAAPPAMAAAPPLEDNVSEVVVTGSRIEPAREARAASSVRKPTEPAARLRHAAARGRTAEVAALLARDTPVDASDDQGETALMKSVRANHPGVAALLRKHGASLDRKNEAGESARDMATVIGDAELNRALGLDR